jgi:hypothetical protein
MTAIYYNYLDKPIEENVVTIKHLLELKSFFKELT